MTHERCGNPKPSSNPEGLVTRKNAGFFGLVVPRARRGINLLYIENIAKIW
jgi:hypothetical protein